MTATLDLPAKLDTSASPALAADLLARAGAPLRIDASGVTHLGGLCLQVLVAAVREWRTDGAGLTIDPRSAAFDGALTAFGLTPRDLVAEGAE